MGGSEIFLTNIPVCNHGLALSNLLLFFSVALSESRCIFTLGHFSYSFNSFPVFSLMLSSFTYLSQNLFCFLFIWLLFVFAHSSPYLLVEFFVVFECSVYPYFFILSRYIFSLPSFVSTFWFIFSSCIVCFNCCAAFFLFLPAFLLCLIMFACCRRLLICISSRISHSGFCSCSFTD